MLAAIERALEPLDRRGLIDAARVSLAVSLVLRFVPAILDHYREIREAQAARGLQANPLALVVPLVVRTLKGADDVAAAIEARGFPPERPGR
jgi:biotin transport system permease protein